MCYGQMIGESMPRARIEHRCDECGRPIKAGRVYYKQTMRDEKPFTFKACVRCLAIAERDRDASGEACNMGGGTVREYQRDEAKVTGWRKYRASLREIMQATRRRLREER